MLGASTDTRGGRIAQHYGMCNSLVIIVIQQIVLEVVASEDMWIWHCFFGLSGSICDISVLHRSHLFARLVSGDALACNYAFNGHDYTMGYYLADMIYPS
jgi:hypothetical protein